MAKVPINDPKHCERSESAGATSLPLLQVCHRHGCLYFPAARVRMAAINCEVV
jgi:hypothetical protein